MVLSSLFLLILGVLPVLPSQMTLFFRPIAIFVCLYYPFYQYGFSRSIWCLLLLQLFLTVVFMINSLDAPSFMNWMSGVLFAAFYVVVVQRRWEKTEILVFLHTILVASLIYSAIILRENGGLLHTNDAGDITFLGVHVNANSAAFGTVPGALTAVSFFLFGRRYRRNSFAYKFFYLGVALLLFYVLIGLGGRSAFFSAVMGSALIAWKRIGSERIPGNRIVFRIILILVVLAVYHYGPILTKGTHAYRLFDYQNLTDANGREEMAAIAWQMIRERPLLGGGFRHWELHSGQYLALHNTFLSYGVIGGYPAMVLLIIFYFFTAMELLVNRHFIPLAFFMESLMHSLTEPGMDYYAYIPLLIAFILHRYSSATGQETYTIVQ